MYCKTGKALSLQVLGHIEAATQLASIVPLLALGGRRGLPQRLGGGIAGVGASVAPAIVYGLAKVITDAQRGKDADENRALGHF